MRALISVFDKEGIVEFARGLIDLGFELVASGGTARALQTAGLEVQDVAELVGGGAILGHRVVTLSREVHAGLLARPDNPDDVSEMERLGLSMIDLVCVDMYPLELAITQPGATRESVIESTDVGGPTMLHAAAKGRRIVICDPADRQKVIDWLKAGRPDGDEFITGLCAKAEAMVASYCLASAKYHGDGEYVGMIGGRSRICTYGENRAQGAALYSCGTDDPLAIDRFVQIEGGKPSYNNFCDLDRMVDVLSTVRAVTDKEYIAIAVKHGNPCGAAHDDFSKSVARGTIAGDPLAVFGGSVITNFKIDKIVADILLHHATRDETRRLLDLLVAPSVTEEAREMLGRKHGKCRIFTNPALGGEIPVNTAPITRPVRGGLLVQDPYVLLPDDRDAFEVIGEEPSEGDWAEMRFAWGICARSSSNTITLVDARYGKLIGNGVGQQARVYAAKLAVERARSAGHDPTGSIACSDSFFPFTDGPEVLIDAGVRMILTTSGSVNDDEVKTLCRNSGVTLVMIPDAVGRGFYRH